MEDAGNSKKGAQNMEKQQLHDQLYDNIMDFDGPAAAETAQAIVNNGYDVIEAIQVATEAVNKIGDKFETGEFFLPHLMRAGKAMGQCMKVLSAHLDAEGTAKKKGTVVIAAVSGDIHDIGKNLVGTMLSVHGFDVVDLGVDVNPMEIADAAERENAKFIALSSLMTTSMPYQKDVLEVLNEIGRRDKFYVVVGGGPVTSEYTQSIGADGWGLSAVSAVKVCDELLKAGHKPPVPKIILVE
jgi:methylmalonyl-CoA mutase cobalamin-binding domain/chain|tara:strand:- start:2202 stop:2924 length:723 start_codon:yes stop_codon:yes gene_type:complete